MRYLSKLLIVLALCLTLGAPLPATAQFGNVPNPVLEITVSPFPMVVNQGARITITATNVGPVNADNVVITDGVPNNLWVIGLSTTQGNYSMFNSNVEFHIGTLAPNQVVTATIDVSVISASPSDTPFNNCAGLTYRNGLARLSCLPVQPAVSSPPRVPVAPLSPNGARPINDPYRPPVLLPVAGGSPIDTSSILLVLGTASLLTAKLIKRKRE
jgi:uncharacterized repeat protein (TIGR01451 family)